MADEIDVDIPVDGDTDSEIPQKSRSMQARLAKKEQQHQEKLMEQQSDYEARLASEMSARQLAEQRAAEAMAEKERTMQEFQDKKYNDSDVKNLASQMAQEMAAQNSLNSDIDAMKQRVNSAGENDSEFRELLEKHSGIPTYQQVLMSKSLKNMKELPGVLKNILQNPEKEAIFNSFNPQDPASEREFIIFMNGIKNEINPTPNQTKRNYEAPPNLGSGGGGLDVHDSMMEYARSRMG